MQQMKKLGFGMMRLPLLNEEDKKSIDKKTVCQMVDTFMERGLLILIRRTCIMSMRVSAR